MTIVNHEGELFHYRGREEFKDDSPSPFKFTPTDEIWPLNQSRASQDTHHFNTRLPICDSSVLSHPVSHGSLTSTSTVKSPLSQSSSIFDIFNEHIKPDLVNSRLRLGPSALRCMVDSTSTSPTKVIDDSGWAGLLLRQPLQNLQAASPSASGLDNPSDMNPSASAFQPSWNSPPKPSAELEAMNDSMAKSLQENSHEILSLQAALQAETSRRIAAETEVTRLSMINKSLASSINMLGSIVKHNMERSSGSEGGSGLQNIQQEGRTASDPRNLRTENNPPNSIIHDVLERQKEHYERDGYPVAQSGPEKAVSHTVTAVSSRDPFDLDLLRRPDHADDSDVAALSRKLRKHFFVSEESVKEDVSQDAVSASYEKTDDYQGDIPPEEVEKSSPGRTVRNQIVNTLNTCRKALDKTKNLMYPARASIIHRFDSPEDYTAVKTSHSELQESINDLSSNPFLSSPTSIPAKYGNAQSVSNSLGGLEKEIITTHEPKRETARTKAHIETPQSPQEILAWYETVNTNSPKRGSKKHRTTENVVVSLTQKPNLKVLTFPYSTMIHWNIHSNNPIFEDEVDLSRAMRSTYSPNPLFWKHPVRYLPDLSEKNLYRTIMIDFIPSDTPLKEVLQHIRGGIVESIQLVPPVGQANTFMTARIVFVYEASAHGLYLQDQRTGIHINGRRVRLWQVLQPTYPRHYLLSQAIDEGASRVLLILDMTSAAAGKLSEKLAPQRLGGFLIDEGMSFDGYRRLEFTSIAEAIKAAETIEGDPELGGTTAIFDDDPCEAHPLVSAGKT